MLLIGFHRLGLGSAPGPLNLGPAESRRAVNLPSRRRAQYLGGRWALRQVCARAAGGRPEDWRFNAEGLPLAQAPAGRAPLWVSLAHSGSWVMVAASSRPGLGVDLEQRGQTRDWPRLHRLLRRWDLGPQARGRSHLDAEAGFLRDWTRYEAAFKAWASADQAGVAPGAASLWDLNAEGFCACVVGTATAAPQWCCLGPGTALRGWRPPQGPQRVALAGERP